MSRNPIDNIAKAAVRRIVEAKSRAHSGFDLSVVHHTTHKNLPAHQASVHAIAKAHGGEHEPNKHKAVLAYLFKDEEKARAASDAILAAHSKHPSVHSIEVQDRHHAHHDLRRTVVQHHLGWANRTSGATTSDHATRDRAKDSMNGPFRKGSLHGKVKVEENVDATPAPERSRTARLVEAAESKSKASTASNQTRCETCGRLQADASSIAHAADGEKLTKYLCYAHEFGSDPRCKPKRKEDASTIAQSMSELAKTLAAVPHLASAHGATVTHRSGGKGLTVHHATRDGAERARAHVAKHGFTVGAVRSLGDNHHFHVGHPSQQRDEELDDFSEDFVDEIDEGGNVGPGVVHVATRGPAKHVVAVRTGTSLASPHKHWTGTAWSDKGSDAKEYGDKGKAQSAARVARTHYKHVATEDVDEADGKARMHVPDWLPDGHGEAGVVKHLVKHGVVSHEEGKSLSVHGFKERNVNRNHEFHLHGPKHVLRKVAVHYHGDEADARESQPHLFKESTDAKVKEPEHSVFVHHHKTGDFHRVFTGPKAKAKAHADAIERAHPISRTTHVAAVGTPKHDEMSKRCTREGVEDEAWGAAIDEADKAFHHERRAGDDHAHSHVFRVFKGGGEHHEAMHHKKRGWLVQQGRSGSRKATPAEVATYEKLPIK